MNFSFIYEYFFSILTTSVSVSEFFKMFFQLLYLQRMNKIDKFSRTWNISIFGLFVQWTERYPGLIKSPNVELGQIRKTVPTNPKSRAHLEYKLTNHIVNFPRQTKHLRCVKNGIMNLTTKHYTQYAIAEILQGHRCYTRPHRRKNKQPIL